jgi:hypothetical protein
VHADIGKGDRVAGAQVSRPPGPVGEGSQLGREGVLAVLGLLERRRFELVLARPPATQPIAPDAPALGHDDEQPVLRMDDQQVGLAVARRRIRVALRDPADVRVKPVGGRQGGAKAVEYSLLRGLCYPPIVGSPAMRARSGLKVVCS